MPKASPTIRNGASTIVPAAFAVAPTTLSGSPVSLSPSFQSHWPSQGYDHDFGAEDEPPAELGEPLFAEFESTRLTLTRATPFFVIPISSAACFDRSRPRPWTPGPPRSLIRTFTERPVAGLVTITDEPIGKVREAAVKASGSYGSPLAGRCPAYAPPW